MDQANIVHTELKSQCLAAQSDTPDLLVGPGTREWFYVIRQLVQQHAEDRNRGRVAI
jgi:hypothetical protein